MNSNSFISTNERLSALFDGVIAIAITLLVLELKLPQGQEQSSGVLLIDALKSQVPELIAWIISFIMIARIWQEQHTIWVYTSKCDRVSIILTFCLLAACSLIPFGSNLLGKYPDTPLVVMIFSALMVINGLLLAMLLAYACSNHNLHRKPGQVRALKKRALYLVTVFPFIGILAIFLAYQHHPLVGVSGWLIEPLALFFYQEAKGRLGT
jgi:uncharacterized membrane protein